MRTEESGQAAPSGAVPQDEKQDAMVEVALDDSKKKGDLAIQVGNATEMDPMGDNVLDSDMIDLEDATRAARNAFAASPKAQPQDPNNPASVKYRPHSGEGRQYMRDMILGVNDGLVSMFLLIFGMAGGDLTNAQILLAGIAGSVAGAISMGLGEYLATKSQKEVYDGDMRLEKEHFAFHREAELKEAAMFLQELGFKGQQLEDALKTIDQDDKRLLKLMMAFEFGLNEEDEREPWIAAVSSGCLFIAGSLPSWLPFTFTTDVETNLIVSGCLCAIALFSAGAIKTIMTHGNWAFAGFENFAFGMMGAGLSYLVGFLYQI